jgi:hypothetical protein
MLIIKIIGIIMIVMGIISFALTVVKAYIFVTVKPGRPLRENDAETLEYPRCYPRNNHHRKK